MTSALIWQPRSSAEHAEVKAKNSTVIKAQSWTLHWWGRPFEATFQGCDFNLSYGVPIAAWLNPHLTTGYAVEISKYFNIQPWGTQNWLECVVASSRRERCRGGRR